MLNNIITVMAVFVAVGFAIAWAVARRQVELRDITINKLKYALKRERHKEPLVIVEDAKPKSTGHGETPDFGLW